MKSFNPISFIKALFMAVCQPLGIMPFGGYPTMQELQQLSTFVNGPLEFTRASLYDTLAYAQAGQTQLTFFQTPAGSGTKTQVDTNMSVAGMLPNPTAFLVQSAQLYFFPGTALVPAPAVGAPGTFSEFVNDVYKFYRYGGYLKLTIGVKDYIVDAPLMKFPPRSGLSGFAAGTDTTTAGAGQNSKVAYASCGGPVFDVNPPIFIGPTVNFSVSLNWNTAQAISAAGTVMVVLDGYSYKKPQ